jgi:2-oxoisovalerate dehydrogenase E1 component alpha subunit
VMAAIGMPPSALFLNQLGRRDDPISGGRMRPAQWNSRKFNVVSASGLIATQTLHAAGIAFAAKLRGEAAVAITFFGEGATSEGDFHEALNFAGVHQLGVIFVCENNGIALSTPQAQQMRAEHVADRAAGYGMPGVVVDGANVLAVIDAAREAFARARSGQGPTLLEIVVPRLPAEEDTEASENLRDPVALFRAYLLARGDLTPESDQHLRDEIAARLDDAERKALAAVAPDPATVSENLYADDMTTQPETAREEV